MLGYLPMAVFDVPDFDELREGFTTYVFKRVDRPDEIRDEYGILVNAIESNDDMVLLGVKENVKSSKHINMAEIMFEYVPRVELSEGLEPLLQMPKIDSVDPKRGVFWGFEGLQISSKQVAPNTLNQVVLSNLNESYLDSATVKIKDHNIARLFTPVIKNGQHPEKWLLFNMDTIDFSSTIKKRHRYKSKILSKAKQTLEKTIAGSENPVDFEMIKEAISSMVRLSVPEFFKDADVVAIEQAMTSKGLQFLEVTVTDDKSAPVSGAIEYDKVYIARIELKLFHRLIDKEVEIDEDTEDLVVSLNTTQFNFKVLHFEREYLQSFGKGSVVKIDAYIVQKEKDNFETNTEMVKKFFEIPKDVQVDKAPVLETQSQSGESSSNTTNSEVSIISQEDQSEVGQESQESKDKDEDNPEITSFDKLEKIISEANRKYGAQGDLGGTPNIRYSTLMISHFCMKYLVREWRSMYEDEEVENSKFEFLKFSLTDGILIESKIPADLEEIGKDLRESYVAVKKLAHARVDQEVYEDVDQITYPIRLDEGTIYFVFRFVQGGLPTLDPDQLVWEMFSYATADKEGFNPQPFETGEYPKPEPIPRNFMGFFDSKQVLYKLCEMMDSYGLKMSQIIYPQVVYDEYEEDQDFKEFERNNERAFFQENEKLPNGKNRWEVDKDKESGIEYFNILTFPLKHTPKDPTYRQLPHPKLSKKDKEVPFPEDLPAWVKKRNGEDFLDFAGEHSFEIKVQMRVFTPESDSKKRAEQKLNFDSFTVHFRHERSECPLLYSESFKFTKRTGCERTFSDDKYMLEFKDSKRGLYESEALNVPVDRVVRLYTFYPTPEGKNPLKPDPNGEAKPLDDVMAKIGLFQEPQVEEIYSNVTAYQRKLTYEFFIVSSIHLDKSLLLPGGQERNNSELKQAGMELANTLKDSKEFKKWRASKSMVSDIIKGVAIKENDFIVVKEGFLALFKTKASNQSEFGILQPKLEVVKYAEKNKFAPVPMDHASSSWGANTQQEVGLRFNASLAKNEGLELTEYLENPANKGFVGKKNFFELVEKYGVEVRDYEHFDPAKRRYDVGTQVTIRLFEEPDDLFFGERKRLIVL